MARPMSYRELATELSKLNDEQLDMDVTIMQSERDGDHVTEEFFMNIVLEESEADDVLDKGHPYLRLHSDVL